jgi:hypothetical protein
MLMLQVALLGLVQATLAVPAAPVEHGRRAQPWDVGEILTFSARWNAFRVGTGVMEVTRIDTVRGMAAYHIRFALTGGVPMYRLNSVMQSWTRVADLKSLRFTQDNDENGRLRERDYEIHPDSGFYRLNGGEALPTPDHPLDDASFIYFLRTQPLEVGREYRLAFYFRKERNPLSIKVEKREACELPDGSKAHCLVVRPVMGDRGIFAARQRTQVWITDDPRRIPVQIRTHYPFGQVTLRLEQMILAEAAHGRGTGAGWR